MPVDGSAKRRAEVARDFGAEIGLGTARRDVEAAVEESIDQRPDDLGAVEYLAAAPACSGRQPIEILDLAIEEHDGNLRPGFLMDGRTTASRFGSADAATMTCLPAMTPSDH